MLAAADVAWTPPHHPRPNPLRCRGVAQGCRWVVRGRPEAHPPRLRTRPPLPRQHSRWRHSPAEAGVPPALPAVAARRARVAAVAARWSGGVRRYDRRTPPQSRCRCLLQTRSPARSPHRCSNRRRRLHSLATRTSGHRRDPRHHVRSRTSPVTHEAAAASHHRCLSWTAPCCLTPRLKQQR